MPRYYFDIKDGHKLVDPSGSNFRNDKDAMARAKIVAIQVALDTPRIDPTRFISVLNEARHEVFRVPVYSKPQAAE